MLLVHSETTFMYSYPPHVYIVYVRGQNLSILLWEKLISHFLRGNVTVEQCS